ncbi:hypothetical protein E3E36_05780 [Thermococcus sp. M36]|uniref:hypothetical protein n=1 Tax=Thermococcus sp. M36 TaxID=1638261 RepID=UPI00143BC84E|nr:hypothetical protein [Thermococcus sp. M36]NJE05659.1 hypothetical protein [Thermococcus sp. M36]
MRKILELALQSGFLIAFWVAMWLFIPDTRKNLNAVNLIAAFSLLVPFLLSARYFMGKALEGYGYSRGDVKRLPEILEKTWGRSYLPREVQEIIGRHIMFWGFFATAIIMAGNLVEGVIGTASVFAVILSFFVLLVSMVIWAIILPLSIHGTLSGEKPHEGLLMGLAVKYNLIFTVILIAVRLMTLHFNPPNPGEPLEKFLSFGRNTRLFESLLELSAINVLFGIAGFYGPRRIGKLAVPVLLAIVVAQLWVMWRLLVGIL